MWGGMALLAVSGKQVHTALPLLLPLLLVLLLLKLVVLFAAMA
jgi:hypothetical protein